MTHTTAPEHLPANVTPAGDGVLIGDGRVTVDAYIDFLCPFCRQFELAAGPALAGLVADGQISLAYHPMNFLDEASTTRYSTRASAASGCASDGGKFVEFTHQMFVGQPPEGGAGLTDKEITEIGVAAGVDQAAFASCLGDGRYHDWPTFVTSRAAQAGVEGTPTVRVNGTDIEPDGESLTAAVQQAESAS
jgi:protein-disulfide isomerase